VRLDEQLVRVANGTDDAADSFTRPDAPSSSPD